MSEENKWGQDPQDTGRTVLTEENALDTNGNADTGSAAETGTDNIDNKPLAHPYSAGRRIQENQRKSTDSSDAAVNNENGMDTPKYAHYQVQWRLRQKSSHSSFPCSDFRTGGRCCFPGCKYGSR